MLKERFSFKFNNLSCMVIIDGREIRPITTITNSVGQEELAAALSQRGFSPTEVISDFNCLFIDTGRRMLLVDSGWGSSLPKMQGRLLRNLEEINIFPADIDLVILTHGDRDHAAGLITALGEATFPNASVMVSREAWEWYNDTANLRRMPMEAANFYQRLIPAIQERVQLFEAEDELIPGLTAVAAPGHRPGHMALRISQNNKHFLHLADTVGHPMLMARPEWRSPYDSFPEQAQETRRQLLEWAAAQDAILFSSHLPFPGLGTLSPQVGGWVWNPIEA